MSKLDRLIAELCPDGVECAPLGEICDITRGRVMSKDYLRDNVGDYPVYSSQTANNGIFGYINTYDYDCESITWTTDGANAGSVFYHVGEKFSITNVCGLLKVKDIDKISAKFIYYILQISAKDYVNDGMGNPKLMSNVMAKVIIPLPPLSIQQEIVRILDKFTELTAELTARKKQYQYYRNELLTFGDDVPVVLLGEVCLHTSNIRWKESDDEYYYIDLTSVDRETNKIQPEQVINSANAPSRAQQIIKNNDVLFATTRPTLQRYCFIPSKFDGQICSTGYCILRANTQRILPKFLYFTITTGNFNLYVENNQEGTSYPAISDAKVKRYKFSLPSLEEQARIVSILDRFDTLTTDITSGLPAEIEARRKQYEYYRDKLLTFPLRHCEERSDEAIQ
jgi:type I restriction enzyme S subunit